MLFRIEFLFGYGYLNYTNECEDIVIIRCIDNTEHSFIAQTNDDEETKQVDDEERYLCQNLFKYD